MLTNADKENIEQVNQLNHWGISTDHLRQLINQHKYSREINDPYTMEYIEYELTDCNFHQECKLLSDGDYAGAYAMLNQY